MFLKGTVMFVNVYDDPIKKLNVQLILVCHVQLIFSDSSDQYMNCKILSIGVELSMTLLTRSAV